MNDRIAVNEFSKSGGYVIQRDVPKRAMLLKEHCTKLGIADARRVFQHLLKHRLKLTGRAADDLQNFRCRGLLLERFAEVVEQPRILDGDDGLLREVLDHLDLPVGKGPY